MTQIERKEIAKEWVEFAKGNFYHTEYPENEQYAPINDEQWDTFGHIMSYLTEDWHNPIPSGTEERQWYRAFASIITDGKEYCREVANTIIDGKSNFFSTDFHVFQMIPFLDLILKK